MNTRQIIVALVVLAVLLIIFTLLAAPAKKKIGDREVFTPDVVTATHTFRDGVHEYSGTVDLPTPCHTLTTQANVAESLPEQVTIVFETEVLSEAEVCAQVITPQDWRVIFQASEEARVSAAFNGEDVALQTIEKTQDSEEESAEE